MNLNAPQQIDRESLNQLSKEELVDIIIEQAIALIFIIDETLNALFVWL
ncbi:hypothetical protein [Nostoc sp.]